MIMNDLYRNELRLYKNYFQPVMKLHSKERIGGKVKRRYEAAKSPYQRLIESNQLPEGVSEQLKGTYLNLNPAQLKRSIDRKLVELCRAYEEKKRTQHVDPHKKLVPRMVRNYMIQQSPVGLGT